MVEVFSSLQANQNELKKVQRKEEEEKIVAKQV